MLLKIKWITANCDHFPFLSQKPPSCGHFPQSTIERQGRKHQAQNDKSKEMKPIKKKNLAQKLACNIK